MRHLLLTGVLTVGTATSLAVAPQAAADQSGDYGSGWSAAIQHQTGAEDNQGRLVMVRPGGGIVSIGDVSDDARILDVSADGQHVLTARDQDGQTRVTVWDTDTKKPSYFRVAEGAGTYRSAGVASSKRHGRRVRTP